MEAAIVVFIVTWIFFAVRANKRKKEYETTLIEKQKELEKSQNSGNYWYGEYKKLEESNDALTNQWNELIEMIEESTSIKELKSALFDEPVESEPNVIVTSLKNEPKVQQVLYFPVPNTSGTFADSTSTAFNASKHMYQFTIVNEQGTKARFSFFNHDLTTKDALTDPQQYLRPVCTYDNAISAKAKQIITIEEGWADKKGNVWNVTQKALIRFE